MIETIDHDLRATEIREANHLESHARYGAPCLPPTFTSAELEMAELLDDFSELNYSDPFADSDDRRADHD